MLHIRPARPDEIPIIAEVERQVWSRAAAPMEELARRQAILPEAFLVAEESGVILGMVNAIRWSECGLCRSSCKSTARYQAQC